MAPGDEDLGARLVDAGEGGPLLLRQALEAARQLGERIQPERVTIELRQLAAVALDVGQLGERVDRSRRAVDRLDREVAQLGERPPELLPRQAAGAAPARLRSADRAR
jgi:hypothetical protein